MYVIPERHRDLLKSIIQWEPSCRVMVLDALESSGDAQICRDLMELFNLGSREVNLTQLNWPIPEVCIQLDCRLVRVGSVMHTK